jgi:hypothetical protein
LPWHERLNFTPIQNNRKNYSFIYFIIFYISYEAWYFKPNANNRLNLTCSQIFHWVNLELLMSFPNICSI